MASYLDQLRITLDEAEELEMEGGELSGDVTESIEDEANTDEVMEESAALEEDLEAMQENADATSDLVETEAATDAVLDAPDEHSESEMEAVAEATQDSFMVTLAKLGVQREDMKHFGVTSDSSLSPLERIKITNDGVKDFLSRLKEHIIAFFRTVKNKIKKLIAKLVVMVTGCTKKADAVIKKYKNRLKKNESFKLRENKTTMMRIVKPMPFLFTVGSMSQITKAVLDTYKSSDTDLIKYLSSGILAILEDSKEYQKSGKGDFKSTANKLEKTLYTNITTKYYSWVYSLAAEGGFSKENISSKVLDNSDYVCTFKALKESEESTPAIVASSGFNSSIKLVRFVVHEDSDSWIPRSEFATVTVKQSSMDKVIKDLSINGEDVKSFMEAIYKASKEVKGITNGCWKHLEDAEKAIIKAADKAAKEGEIKNGDFIKISSIYRSVLSSVTFTKVMEYALGCRKLLGISVAMAEAIIDDEKQSKKDNKRTGSN